MLDPRQAALYRTWYAACPEPGRAPPRSAFDPLDNPRAMSTLVLAEVDGPELVFRVVGTDMVEAWGRDYTGERLSDIMSGAYHDFIRGLFDEAIATQRAIFSHSRFQWDRGRTMDTKRLMLPYRRDEAADAVGFVLVSQIFDYAHSGPATPEIAVDTDFDLLEIARRVLNEADAAE